MPIARTGTAPADLVDADLEHPSGLVGVEGEALAAAPAPEVDADTGVGHAVEVGPEGGLVEATLGGRTG